MASTSPQRWLVAGALLATSGALAPFRRVSASARSRVVAVSARSEAALKEGIAAFYDESSGIWEDVWGEHMHHGWYEPGTKAGSLERVAEEPESGTVGTFRSLEHSVRRSSIHFC